MHKIHGFTTSTHIFASIAIETLASWNEKAIETIQEMGRRMTKATNNLNETVYLSNIQQYNAVSFLNTLPEEHDSHLDH